MAVSLVQVNGAFTDNSSTVPSGEQGSGVVIGNGYVLTAGHIVFEFNRKSAAPAVISSFAGAFDYRGYQGAYLSAANASLNNITGLYPANTTIEAKLFSQDSVVIQQSGVTVSKTSAGLGAFSDVNDLLSTKTILQGSSAVSRDGLNTGQVSGKIISIYQGDLNFNKPANTGSPNTSGDSGGSYSLNYDRKTFILGTQSSNKGGTTALGTILTFQNIDDITATITANETGNISGVEPTNLFVGSTVGDTITGSLRPDLILGRDGNDTLDGGDPANATRWGNDQLFGGNGDDTLIAGKGNNLYHGGIQNLTAASDHTIEGTDTVDYSQLTATDPKLGIKVQIGTTPVNNTWKANKDFAHASFVTDLGRDKGVDTLISVEKVTGTSADDIVAIKQLSATTLANANHVGGIDVIDLGAEDKSSKYKGDYVDLSGLDEAAKVTLNGPSLNVAAAADATRVVTIKNDEHILGSKQNDLFQAQGTPAAIDFASGGGHDLVETEAGGTYDLKLRGLNVADITIIAGGQDLYRSVGDGTHSTDVYEFIAFQINSTGETITFVNKGEAVAVGHDPDGPSGVDDAIARTPITSVEFANGTKWDATQIWNAVGNGHGSANGTANVRYDTYVVSQYYPGNQQQFVTHINATYFQADPVNAPSPTAAFLAVSPPTQESLAASSTGQIATVPVALAAPAEPVFVADSSLADSDQGAPQKGVTQIYANPITTVGQASSAENDLSSTIQSGSARLSDAALILRNYNTNRASPLSAVIDSTANLVGSRIRQGSQIQFGTIPSIDAVGASNFNRLIEAMAAFHAGEGIGTLDTSAMRNREFGSHPLTLAVAH